MARSASTFRTHARVSLFIENFPCATISRRKESPSLQAQVLQSADDEVHRKRRRDRQTNFDRVVCRWDVATGKKLEEWKMPSMIWKVAYAPDGRHVAVGLGNGQGPRPRNRDADSR